MAPIYTLLLIMTFSYLVVKAGAVAQIGRAHV